MTEQELREHLDFIDGIQKAQMLVLRELLRENAELKSKVRRYAEQLDENPLNASLSDVQLGAMKTHMLGLSE
ncbi:hypothetical protein [Janthinobacterium lividum]|uniref:hypothetical protein n=1 Tax=Janthinobacterium lividum TaxID=29581 RepID=UPI000873E83B|nr:hypothetical protein [Janthinobacterium lividum]MCC7714685.1 hypothetical protein [Janthinobacterium lividum]OEZ56062.1 hypothetical protein JANLI_30160 [Janthinobacterium lividum]WQE30115.1 hypothetical protein U0004_06775 [Janthinobacterium lividum]STQ95614.1 Uncharacterised protein [Janthinobacterium lividum]